ncbi:MAG: response regulator, partial [Thermodesulfobacteriota bacterium]|nr:response regulator [Thermodesulfobacteriota bacterium]
KEAGRTEIRTLVVDDDFTNRLLLQELLKIYGPVHIAVNGKEAVDAIVAAGKNNTPYDLICLDIMMPEMDGQEALKQIRAHEAESGVMLGKGVKIIMTTALGDSKNVLASFKGACDGYIVKPIVRTKLIELLQKFSLIK